MIPVVLYSHSAADIFALTTTTHVNVHLLGAALFPSVSFSCILMIIDRRIEVIPVVE